MSVFYLNLQRIEYTFRACVLLHVKKHYYIHLFVIKIVEKGLQCIVSAKVNEVKGEIPNITDLATTIFLSAVENKVPSVSNLVKKTDYNIKINEIKKKVIDHDHDKSIATPEFNQLTAKYFPARLKQADLASKRDKAIFLIL